LICLLRQCDLTLCGGARAAVVECQGGHEGATFALHPSGKPPHSKSWLLNARAPRPRWRLPALHDDRVKAPSQHHATAAPPPQSAAAAAAAAGEPRQQQQGIAMHHAAPTPRRGWRVSVNNHRWVFCWRRDSLRRRTPRRAHNVLPTNTTTPPHHLTCVRIHQQAGSCGCPWRPGCAASRERGGGAWRRRTSSRGRRSRCGLCDAVCRAGRAHTNMHTKSASSSAPEASILPHACPLPPAARRSPPTWALSLGAGSSSSRSAWHS
jgi:hypothetical protein